MSIVAIDPGANGGMAFFDGETVRAFKMPDTYPGILDALRELRLEVPAVRAVVEKAGQHVAGNNASASCKFARHVGHLEMALYAANIPQHTPVHPRTWQRSLGTLPKDKSERKRRIKELMQAQYPYLDVTLWNADALGILTWAMKEGE